LDSPEWGLATAWSGPFAIALDSVLLLMMNEFFLSKFNFKASEILKNITYRCFDLTSHIHCDSGLFQKSSASFLSFVCFILFYSHPSIVCHCD
jgi:hypothetical protein